MSRFFSDDYIEQVRSLNDIVDVVSQYVPLQQKGSRYWGCCPFHQEKTPSFCVNPDMQFYYCFGCHAGGNVNQFVMHMEKCDFPESVQLLAERVNLPLPEDIPDPQAIAQKDMRSQLYAVGTAAAHYFHDNLFSDAGKDALAYLLGRGLGKSTIRKFGLGYAPHGWDGLIRHLEGLGISAEAIDRFGLTVTGDRGRYDTFRERIMFPIIDQRRRVIGFGGRVMDKSLPKYINSRQTDVYNKGYNLYGIHNLRTLGHIEHVMIVEGYMDVISVYQAGYPAVVASLGTALTAEQAKLLRRYCSNVYIAYDGDAAGQAATLRGMDILSQADLRVWVVSFPDGMDPDDYARTYGLAGIQDALSKAKPLNEYKLLHIKQQYDLSDYTQRMEFVSQCCQQLLAQIQSPVERSVFIQQIHTMTGIPVSAIEEEVAMVRSHEAPAGTRTPRSTPRQITAQRSVQAQPDNQALFFAQRLLLKRLLADGKIASAFGGIDETFFADARLQSVFKAIAGHIMQGTQLHAASLMDSLEQPEREQLAGILQDETLDADNDQLLQDCFRQLVLYHIQAQMQQISRQLTQGILPAEREELKRQYASLAAQYGRYKASGQERR